MPEQESVVDEAVRIVKDRRATYGSPVENWTCTAAMWSSWLSVRLGQPITLTAADCCHLMILLKSARLAKTPDHRDSLVDVVGYLSCVEACNKVKE